MPSRTPVRAPALLTLAAACIALVGLAPSARAEPPTCPCLGDWPVAAPLLCYDAPGARLNTFSFTSPPAIFAQVYGSGRFNLCRANGRQRWTTPAEAASCREDLQWQCGCGSPSAVPVHTEDFQTTANGVHWDVFDSGPGRQMRTRFELETSTKGLFVRVRQDRCIEGVRDRFLYEIRLHTVVYYYDTGDPGLDENDEITFEGLLGSDPLALWPDFFHVVDGAKLTSSSRAGQVPGGSAGLFGVEGEFNLEQLDCVAGVTCLHPLRLHYLFSLNGGFGQRVSILGDLVTDYRTTDPASPSILPSYTDCGRARFRRVITSESVDVPGHQREVSTFVLLTNDDDAGHDCIWD